MLTFVPKYGMMIKTGAEKRRNYIWPAEAHPFEGPFGAADHPPLHPPARPPAGKNSGGRHFPDMGPAGSAPAKPSSSVLGSFAPAAARAFSNRFRGRHFYMGDPAHEPV